MDVHILVRNHIKETPQICLILLLVGQETDVPGKVK